MIQNIVTMTAVALVAPFFLAGFLHFSRMFLECHKELRISIRRWLGWREINHVEYQRFLRALASSSDYSHKDWRLGEGAKYSEADWDAGRQALDTFSRQDGDVVDFQQKPRSETGLYFCRIRRSRYGVRVELMKEGWMQPCNGAEFWSYMTNRTIELTGPPVIVCFYNSGTLPQLPT